MSDKEECVMGDAWVYPCPVHPKDCKTLKKDCPVEAYLNQVKQDTGYEVFLRCMEKFGEICSKNK